MNTYTASLDPPVVLLQQTKFPDKKNPEKPGFFLF
jgi:hypothetical protein